MNPVLSAYYGTLPREKASSLLSAESGVEETLLLRECYVRSSDIRAGEKTSASTLLQDQRLRAAVSRLGGQDTVLEKLSAQAEWMKAWDAGEKDGTALAVAVMEQAYEDRQSRR